MKALLIRHGETAAVGRCLSGRSEEPGLNEVGHRQAEGLARWLSQQPIQAIYTSPLQRARQTVEPLARALGVEACIRHDLTEVDFGLWTGLTFDQLQGREDWRQFNTHRASAPVPGGESLPAVQARVINTIQELATVHGPRTIAIVSHAELIRSAVLYYLAMPLDRFQLIDISPASITSLIVGEDGPRFLGINEHCLA